MVATSNGKIWMALEVILKCGRTPFFEPIRSKEPRSLKDNIFTSLSFILDIHQQAPNQNLVIIFDTPLFYLFIIHILIPWLVTSHLNILRFSVVRPHALMCCAMALSQSDSDTIENQWAFASGHHAITGTAVCY